MKTIEILEFPKDIPRLLNLVKETRKTFRIVTPFYEEKEVKEILWYLPHKVKLRALTRADQNSNIQALEKLLKRGKVKLGKKIHAKVLVFDESAAIISSLNIAGWGSLNLGVLLRGKICKEIANIVDKWWKESETPSPGDIARLKREISRKRKPPSPRHLVGLGKDISVPRYKFTSDVEEHIIININWSPRNYERGCTREEVEENILCLEQRQCLREKWYQRGGCASSWLFEDYKYATRKGAIKKGRLAFFIAKNPNLHGKYYFVGVLCMKGPSYTKSGRPEKGWGKNLFYFNADKGKSIRFPSSRSKAITLDSVFGKRLGSPLRGNPTRKISKNDAIRILEKYCSKTDDEKAKQLIELLH